MQECLESLHAAFIAVKADRDLLAGMAKKLENENQALVTAHGKYKTRMGTRVDNKDKEIANLQAKLRKK